MQFSNDREVFLETNQAVQQKEGEDNEAVELPRKQANYLEKRKKLHRRRKERRRKLKITKKDDHDHDHEKYNKMRLFRATAAPVCGLSLAMAPKRGHSSGQVKLALLLSLTCLIGFVCQAAVVRPTIFSDLNASDTTSQQVPPATAQTQTSSSSINGGNAPNQLAENGLQTSTSTKINPLKSRFCTTQNGVKLDGPLGLQSFAIDDFALSASSYSNEQVGPHLARLNLDISGGAWCPGRPISNSNFGKEWIQVKLNRSFVVSSIETQGRFMMGSGKEFVPSYQVEYSRNSGNTWHKWKDVRGLSLLRGNEDANSAVKNELSPPIVGANVIRILPFSQHLRTVCLRFELYGCPYDEGAPIAYETTDGVPPLVEPRWGHLTDYTYDGAKTPSRSSLIGTTANNNQQQQQQQQILLSKGLGQLIDGVKGNDNFSFNNGFEWVGWKSMNGDVVIEFTFKTLRNFTGALFHSNNLFSNGVEVFQAVDVHYGIDNGFSMEALRDAQWERARRQRPSNALSRIGRQLGAGSPGEQDPAPLPAAGGGGGGGGGQTMWSADVLSIEYEPDKKSESSRPVTVHLKQRLANKLKFVLKFASKWILVSEVEFLSHPVELLSLASFNEQHTPALMSALAPAKSYDEYVAILREHQLRQIATNAYLEAFNALSSGAGSSSSSSSSTGSPGQSLEVAAGNAEQSDSAQVVATIKQQQQQPSLSSYGDNDYHYSTQSAPVRTISGPAIPSYQSAGNQVDKSQPQLAPADVAVPITNPLLSTVLPYSPHLRQIFESNNNNNNNNVNNQVELQQTKTASEATLEERRTIGLATVISFVLVSILLTLGLLFAVSSYRLRQQARMGVPLALPRHCLTPSGAAKSSGPSLNRFMSVFSPSSVSGASRTGKRHQQQQQQQLQQHTLSPNDPQLYHTLFGANHGQTTARAANTLKRLESLTGAGSGNGATHKTAHPLLSQHQSTASNQLLVSVKDCPGSHNSSPLFGGSTLISGANSKAGQQQVSTQLIVGLNQVNPFAQQQIYNNSSSLNCSNQTYATHYSASMSSSTTTGHNQADYADYAIPDAQPIVPPLAPAPAHLNLAYSHHQHQQAHTFKHPLPHYTLGYQTTTDNNNNNSRGLAMSANQHQNRNMSTLIQPAQQQQQQQQQQARQLPSSEHNYELIYQIK